MMRRKLVVGNWKMNGTRAALAEIEAIVGDIRGWTDVEVVLALPATLIAYVVDRAPGIVVGAQDIHAADAGPFTGCVSAAMVRDVGGDFTLAGHSERRMQHQESDADAKAKAEAARRHALRVITCVGETMEDRDAGRAVSVVASQLAASLPDNATGDWLAIAYEPVWAIGTGRTPTVTDIATMHGALRTTLRRMIGSRADAVRLLYGGSVTVENAAPILDTADVDGVLVGSASLNSTSFVMIVSAARTMVPGFQAFAMSDPTGSLNDKDHSHE